jgi:proteasome lid subunit RPN8/RPN11
MNEIHLPAALYEEMVHHLTTRLPEEACGLVGGLVDGLVAHAVRVYPIENILHSPVAYEMDPLPQIRAMLDLEAADLELVAIFHSHPSGPARPSSTDVEQAYYPDSAYLIISLADQQRPTVRGFMLGDGKAREIDVVLIS